MDKADGIVYRAVADQVAGRDPRHRAEGAGVAPAVLGAAGRDAIARAKPSIAAVQGGCIAGGLLLAWPCDLILAADNAFFSDPVVLMGIGGALLTTPLVFLMFALIVGGGFACA